MKKEHRKAQEDELDLLLYKKMYLHLFNAVTDALEGLNAGRTEQAKRSLIAAQQRCEELFIEGPEREKSP
ncbi:MAG: hypothetical protein K6G17_01945 [Oscillospiraceae bacterium]|nr:hypothetical protein [Oscillospiraceae bacterium]